MKVVQLVTHLNIWDAIGNEILAMDETLKKAGYDTAVMAQRIHGELRYRAKKIDLSALNPEDLVIFHKATGDLITKEIAALSCKKVMRYHNITPAKYYFPYDKALYTGLKIGRSQVYRYASQMDNCWSVSAFNATDLECAGVRKEQLSVLPILVSGEEYRIQPDSAIVQRLKAIDGTKLLAVGRIAPNKKLEDVIKAYTVYKETKDADAVLFLVGGWEGMERYYAKLKGFAADLNLRDDQIIFTGKVSEEEKEAYYRNADALLCLSEHEGFCVPLIEASARDLPILAYKAAAVPETLGGSGVQFRKKDYETMAEALERLKTDPTFRQRIIEGQRENLKRFDPERVRSEFLRLVKTVTGGPSSGTQEQMTQQEIETIQIPDDLQIKEDEESGLQRKGTNIRSFKPLWRIHNATYRTLSRGCTRRMMKQMFSRFRDLIKS